MKFTQKNTLSRLTESSFGPLSTGEQASLFTLKNRHGMQVNITNYGGIIVSIFTFDKHQRLHDIVLGYDRVQDYEEDTYYLGAIIGRYAGRIDQGMFDIDGQSYQLVLNAPDSQLHGGERALNKQLWQATTDQNDDSATLVLSHKSPDGTEGYPGTVEFTVKYQLTDDNSLNVEYFAKTDKTTIINLTQHSYFNLAGHNSGDILQHAVAINAEYFLPMTERAYPTGEIRKVQNTPHDFSQLTPIAAHINNTDDEQIRIGLGFDNYWLANENSIDGTAYTAQVVEHDSKRRMTIYSDQPSIILYTANYIDGSHYGKGNFRYQQRAGLCLEPQRANNRSSVDNIHNTLITPTTPFYSKTRYVFDTLT